MSEKGCMMLDESIRGKYVGAGLVLLSAVGFGFLPIFALYAYESGITVMTLLILRFTIAAACFFGYIGVKRETWRVTRRELFFFLILGGGLYTAQSSLYFSSVKYIPTALAALLLYLYPLFVAILAFVIDKERFSGKMLVAAVLSLSGMAVVLKAPISTIDWYGAAMAASAAGVYSLYILLSNRVLATVPPVLTSAYVAAFASLSLVLLGITTGAARFDFPVTAWPAIIAVALVSTVLAMATFFGGIKLLGPARASLISTVEPVITAGCAAVLFGEQLAALQYFGGILVLAGAVLVILERQNKKEDCI